MKRIFLKSSAIISVIVAFALIALWAISLSYDPKAAQLAFGRDPSFVCVAVGKGDLILCDHFDNREVIHLVDTRVPMHPFVTKDICSSLPGFSFRHLTLTSGQRIWSLDLSLLIPGFIMIFTTGLFVWGLRVLKGVEHTCLAAAW